MNELKSYFEKNPGRLMDKWIHYFEVYERHFHRYKSKDIVILEIGVSHGGSLQMWKQYFGDKARIYAIDIDPRCKSLEEESIEIFIGSQSDRQFLRNIKSQIPKVDILIDDGGHTMVQQIVTFEELFDHVKEDGVFLFEDLHTSYWLKYGGGHKRRGTFIEYSKNFIDAINAYHSVQKSLQPDAFTKSVDSLHYYDSILVIEKSKREKPYSKLTGIPSFEDPKPKPTPLTVKAKRKLLGKINIVLRFLRLPGFIWR